MPKGIYIRKNKKTPQELAENRKKYQESFRKDPKNLEIAKKHAIEYAKNPRRIEYRVWYRKQNRERDIARHLNKKISTYNLMGGKCVMCGFADFRALQIDHVNGDGHIETKNKINNGDKYLDRVVASFIKKEGRYQLLCANCNWIKRFNNKEDIKR